jgi:hypothetical protein
LRIQSCGFERTRGDGARLTSLADPGAIVVAFALIVEAAFDDEEDLGRSGVVVGRWPVRALAELAAGDGHCSAGGVAVGEKLDHGGG